ncbi:hypothetical protein [Streptomyces triticiradicis]|uniref:Uncharacterized protein n=1 Tax=Streptomyces triticiradicis TaxID=2651189 RepID=A0A7J5DFK2_9ACTN|nr:hypothetical protein [Streptomyces triticiradicis]KAB1987650.1 hypothetical protein F8144_16440 [Streptomyces triticiradicis]
MALLCAVVPSAACTAAAGKPAARRTTGVETKAAAATPSCAGGAVRWSSVNRERRLTEVSPVVNVGENDGWVTYHLGLVRNIVPQVSTSDARVSAHQVLVALAEHLKRWDVEELAAPGEESADRRRHPVETDSLGHAGRFVEAEGVQVVDASFTVTCPGRDVYGSVTTWFDDTGASLACGVNPRTEEAWIHEAYRLTCGPPKP